MLVYKCFTHINVFSALASRCLQLVVYYMPMVRKHFEEKLVNNKTINMLKHFDQILKVSISVSFLVLLLSMIFRFALIHPYVHSYVCLSEIF